MCPKERNVADREKLYALGSVEHTSEVLRLGQPWAPVYLVSRQCYEGMIESLSKASLLLLRLWKVDSYSSHRPWQLTQQTGLEKHSFVSAWDTACMGWGAEECSRSWTDHALV